ncbi:hypothetical protein IF2G_06976 [Cordyceps javanica]|nr:hypothetical protein IF2G_06976 [Cordyceps javanica]
MFRQKVKSEGGRDRSVSRASGVAPYPGFMLLIAGPAADCQRHPVEIKAASLNICGMASVGKTEPAGVENASGIRVSFSQSYYLVSSPLSYSILVGISERHPHYNTGP